jgi:Brp/Blh family beta-carotene 15,15'-monooxygenase
MIPNILGLQAKLLIGAALLGIFYSLEQTWQSLGWWLFVLITLSLGMGHGALDAVLLLAQFAPRSKALIIGAAYLLSVLLIGWLLSWSIGLALLALIVMSVWHFGELQDNLVQRMAVGGASVMTPMLVAHTQTTTLIKPLLVADQFSASLMWYRMSMVWCILVSVWFICSLIRNANSKYVDRNIRIDLQQPKVLAVLEIVCVVILYMIFTPLVAFALYFGWHSIKHIEKVQKSMFRHYGILTPRYAIALATSIALTLVFLGILWFLLIDKSSLTQDHSIGVLQWIIVALAALTMPHLLLVSYSRNWLKN